MYQTLATLLLLTLMVRSLNSTTSLPAAPVTSTKMVVKLIHRDSIHSLHDNDMDQMKRAVERSIARFNYIQKVLTASARYDVQTDLLPDAHGSIFLANISIGQPPVPQLVVIDTGSSLLWVKCVPCERCSNQLTPLFDPKKSSTYTILDCHTYFCRVAVTGRCDMHDQCEYTQQYVRGDKSVGLLSMDQVTLETHDEGLVSIPNVIFGCDRKYGNLGDNQISGVLGLNFERISLVGKMGIRFSYCIGSALDPNYTYNKLILGEDGVFQGDSTPLKVLDGFYYVTLEGISVGEKRLTIDSNLFKINTSSSERSGVLIDSGATGTWLVKEGYEAVENEVKNLLNKRLSRVWFTSYRLCYKGTIDEDLVGFPTLTFHFANEAVLELDTHSLFLPSGKTQFCLAMYPSSVHNDITHLSIIGILAQQNYNVGFDISESKMTFQRIDCQYLYD